MGQLRWGVECAALGALDGCCSAAAEHASLRSCSLPQAAVWQPDMGPDHDRIVFDPWTLRIR